MSRETGPIRWCRDLGPARWWVSQLDDSYDRVSALVPPGFPAQARLVHPVPARNALPVELARSLIDLLRDETATPDRCWFCVVDRYLEVDDQGVAERVSLPSGGASYLLHGGPIDRAVAEPPALPSEPPPTIGPGTTLEELSDRLEEQAGSSVGYLSTTRPTPAEVLALMADQPAVLPEEPATLWWPDDRAWFVATDLTLGATYVAGSRRLLERLTAHPALEVREAHLTDGFLAASHAARR